MRYMIPAVLAFFLASPAVATDLQALSDDERESFRAEVRAYILENPEVLLEAMDILRARERAAEEARDQEALVAYRNEIFNDGISWVGGNPEGDITIVEFLDYRCGYCRRAHKELADLLEVDGNIRWVVKEFPILGPDSEQSARLAVATLRKLGDAAYGRLHDVLMKFEGPVNDKTLPVIAKRADIDLSAVSAEMSSPEVGAHIERVAQLAQVLGVSGTPSFVIGDQMVKGYVPAVNMLMIVQEEREKEG